MPLGGTRYIVAAFRGSRAEVLPEGVRKRGGVCKPTGNRNLAHGEVTVASNCWAGLRRSAWPGLTINLGPSFARWQTTQRYNILLCSQGAAPAAKE